MLKLMGSSIVISIENGSVINEFHRYYLYDIDTGYVRKVFGRDVIDASYRNLILNIGIGGKLNPANLVQEGGVRIFLANELVIIYNMGLLAIWYNNYGVVVNGIYDAQIHCLKDARDWYYSGREENVRPVKMLYNDFLRRLI